MKTRINVAVVFLILGSVHQASAESAGENKTVSLEPVKGMRKMVHDGRERSYFLYIPSKAAGLKSLPMVIALHGGRGTAAKWPSYTNHGFERLAGKEPFVLVYPEGIKGHWNDERNYPTSYAHTHNIDDIGFLITLVDYLVDTYPIDKNRVYVTGVSNGGMMAHYLAGMAADRIAAVATVISTIPRNLVGKLNPGKPVSVLMINGKEDSLVPWEGGAVKFGRRRNGYVISVEDTVKYWVEHNGCKTAPDVTRLPDRDSNDGTTVSRTMYSKGRQDTEVVLYTVFGGGHTWPAYEDKRPAFRRVLLNRLVGRRSRDIDGSEIIWNFFKTHPRR